MVTFMDETCVLQNLGLFVGVGLFFIICAVIHLFIAVVNFYDWLKGRTMTVIDKIVSSLSIARGSFQLACLINMFLETCYEDSLLFSVVKRCGDFTELLSNSCCICFFALLILMVCLKVSNIHHVYFHHLKFITARRIVHLITASVVMSILHTTIFIWIAELLHSENSNDSYIIDYSDHNVALQYVYFYTLGSVVPFFMQLTCSFLVIYSLCVHLKRMKGRTNLNTQADQLYSAIRASIFCFLNFILQIILTITIVYHYETLGTVFSYVTWNFFPTIHSIYLIHSTAKLKNVFFRILQGGR
uniref:Taste receptor type 2 n=1 Tax=Pyxicephalus adspersus TaxID=30357 RepID=A0AAV3AJV4_PYXAD|nr:TPA: hypothetical protein GDO54_009868 [Pyxicephalus adspersus]